MWSWQVQRMLKSKFSAGSETIRLANCSRNDVELKLPNPWENKYGLFVKHTQPSGLMEKPIIKLGGVSDFEDIPKGTFLVLC